jgi:16S rRNA (cytosine967-C5)-methyltransferase
MDGLLARTPTFRLLPITASEIGAEPGWITAGDVRTLPFHLGELGGIDGFYISRLQRCA